jgi:S1-C subfamily serine protease
MHEEVTAMINRISRLATLAVAAMFAVTAGSAGWPLSPGEEPTLAPLLDEVTAGVVNVSVVGGAVDNPLANDPFFQRFFDLPDELPPRYGVGSGVIVDAEEGLILSNHHVSADAVQIVVVLSDRREFNATIIGSDAGTDIAVLKIEADNLTALSFADSDSLRVGDFVVAIGNPFGLGQTATTGIVSAMGRTGINLDGYEDFIQTDASINPGNSGGALINLEGGLVGINTAIVSTGGGNVGIGFAVPSKMAHAVMTEILEFGEVHRGQLGVTIQLSSCRWFQLLRRPPRVGRRGRRTPSRGRRAGF